MRKLTLIGNVGNDATETVHADKKAIHFSLCVNEKYKTKTGEEVEKAYWYDCTLWVPTSKQTNYLNLFTKGSTFYLEGTPNIYTYNKGNETIAGISLNVDYFKIIRIKEKTQEVTND